MALESEAVAAAAPVTVVFGVVLDEDGAVEAVDEGAGDAEVGGGDGNAFEFDEREGSGFEATFGEAGDFTAAAPEGGFPALGGAGSALVLLPAFLLGCFAFVGEAAAPSWRECCTGAASSSVHIIIHKSRNRTHRNSHHLHSNRRSHHRTHPATL